MTAQRANSTDVPPESRAAAPTPVLEEALREQAAFLEPLKESLAGRWSELYLESFGRGSLYSSQRVHRLFQELSDLFVGCLKEKRLETYLQTLKDHGRTLCQLGIPFEEVIVCLHLFEEACSQILCKAFPNRRRLPELLLAFEDIHHRGLESFAVSYFETAREDLRRASEAFREDADALRRDLSDTQSRLFSHTARELGQMNLLLSGINQKMRRRVYQLSRLNQIAEVLESEAHLPRLLALSASQILALCPDNSAVYFGLFEEESRNSELFLQTSRRADHAELLRIVPFSELHEPFREALYGETKRGVVWKSPEDLPPFFLEPLAARSQKEFFLAPIRKFRETTGFILIGSSEKDFFVRPNHKFFYRVCQTVSKAVVTASLFAKTRKREEMQLMMDELSRQLVEERPVEATLDYCLGSLMDLLGVERTSIMRFDARRRELRVCAAKGYKVYPIAGAPIKWGEGIAGAALRDSKIISIAKMRDAAADRERDGGLFGRPRSHEVRLKSLLCIPLADESGPLGVLNLSTINYYKNFDRDDVDLAHHVVRRVLALVKELAPAEP